MGRGRVELKRIENNINRQVTFAKRRNGLFKKAYELSVLCDAEVAVIIFSNRGKLYEFCSSSSMLKTIQRYQIHTYGALEANQHGNDTQKNYQEYLQLKSTAEVLQRSQRNILGEDLRDLGTQELDQLEQQLDMSLKRIRLKKAKFMLDQLSEHERKVELLMESNNALRMKLEEIEAAVPAAWKPGEQSNGYSREPANSITLEPLHCKNSLQIGLSSVGSDQGTASTATQNVNGFVPGWMLKFSELYTYTDQRNN
ncbi:hypothetical protein K2173_017013 [Erythroxylum novogranatense]|uniref:Uncharacterized protein n=1 Tax=Erythroxylum novogranatense TaxID=1862640 RepID=A0AAV8U5G8_9ROSI|nr:hypothetical protein K2173_017013 [Erythroxylum novogranatense]